MKDIAIQHEFARVKGMMDMYLAQYRNHPDADPEVLRNLIDKMNATGYAAWMNMPPREPVGIFQSRRT